MENGQREKIIAAQLLFMFKYTVAGRTLDLALVQPLDAPTGPQCSVDRDLRLRRFRSRPRASAEIISLKSVVRGALLAPDFSRNGDFFLVNYIDGDMFIRAQRYDLH